MFSFHDKWPAWVVVALLFLFMLINYADKAVIGWLAVSVMHALSPAKGFDRGCELLGALLVFSGLMGLCLVTPEKSRTKFSRLIQTSGSRRSADAGVSKRISHDGGLIKQDKE
jgi:hypothetical protein